MPAVTRERLSVDDAQILRLESAAIKGHTGKVLILAPDSQGRPASVSRLRARISFTCRTVRNVVPSRIVKTTLISTVTTSTLSNVV